MHFSISKNIKNALVARNGSGSLHTIPVVCFNMSLHTHSMNIIKNIFINTITSYFLYFPHTLLLQNLYTYDIFGCVGIYLKKG